MLRSALGVIVALGLMIPVTWGWGKWQYYQGKWDVTCVAPKQPMSKSKIPKNELPFELPFGINPLDIIIKGLLNG